MGNAYVGLAIGWWLVALVILVGGCVLISTVFRKAPTARAITGGIVAVAMLAVATWVVANYAARQKTRDLKPVSPPFHWRSHWELLLLTVFALGVLLTTGVGAIAERKRRTAWRWQIASLLTAGIALGVLVALPERHLATS
jgi:hypothetical protein